MIHWPESTGASAHPEQRIPGATEALYLTVIVPIMYWWMLQM
jgi:hypothetical protein